jgi:hypothetical protein
MVKMKGGYGQKGELALNHEGPRGRERSRSSFVSEIYKSALCWNQMKGV